MTAKLYPKVFQAAFEVRGALFLNGKCNRTRITGQSAVITFPSTNMGDVSIHAAWAKSYSSGVKLALPFIIVPSAGLAPILSKDSQEVTSGNVLHDNDKGRGICIRPPHNYCTFGHECSAYGPDSHAT